MLILIKKDQPMGLLDRIFQRGESAARRCWPWLLRGSRSELAQSDFPSIVIEMSSEARQSTRIHAE